MSNLQQIRTFADLIDDENLRWVTHPLSYRNSSVVCFKMILIDSGFIWRMFGFIKYHLILKCKGLVNDVPTLPVVDN